MLTAYRRHLQRCAFRKKGQNFTLCDCPVWCYGRVGVGAPIRRSLATNNWDEAIRRLMAIEVGEFSPEPRGCSVAEAAALYLADCEARNVRATTLASYRRTLSTFPDMRLAHVSTAHVSAWRADRKVSTGTQRKELEHLRFFFNWCRTRKLISENPAAAIKPPRVEQRITMPYSQDEVTRLLAACDQIFSDNPAETGYIRRRARCFVLLLLYSGLRRGDAAVLRRSALGADGRLTLRTEKTGVRLQVQLPEAVAGELSRLPADNPEYFFWSGRSKPATVIGNLWRTVNRLGAIAEVHAHPHRFRDTFACRLLEKGADIRSVQKLLGHTSVRTTEKHYGPWIEAHQKLLDVAAAKLDFLPRAAPVVLRKRKASG